MARRKSALTDDWPAARDAMRTGDVILYSGGKAAVSVTIKRLTASKWSHVGLVVREPDDGQPMLWESVLDEDMPDLETGQTRNGVRLVPLEPAVVAYTGVVAVRHLDVKRTKKRLADFEAFRLSMRGVPFEKSKVELLRARRGGNSEEDFSSVFCSELAAKAYVVMGLLSKGRPCNDYVPRDFCSDTDPPLALLRGATLGPEVVIAR